MTPNWPLRLWVGSAVVTAVIAAILAIVLQASGTAPTLRLLYLGVAAAWLAMALLVLERQPGHAVGRILLAFGTLLAYFFVADLVVAATFPSDLASVAAWFVSSVDGPFFLIIALLFLLFPDGRPPSDRWRAVIGLGVVSAIGVTLGAAFKPGPFAYYPHIENPFGIAGFPLIALWEPAYLLLIGFVGLSALSLIGRWRRGGPREHAQLKWVAAAAILVALAMASYAVVIGPGRFSDAFDLALAVTFGCFPIAVGIAILRYRLFEIDRLVSRTIAYIALTTILVGAYAAVILLLQGPLGSVTGGDTIPVAISTLVVAALFQPVRRRVQAIVDRRFDRARFDAERTSGAFAERLRDGVDVDAVTADLRTTVQAALKPAGQGLWLRDRRPAR